ncbi:MAG: hypothetical protein IPL72_00140 [Sulfuritalea sp.]|nr:hypothetical protein [Sulfuritalea sp.]
MSIELDIGPLSWVKGEIDLALERAGESLTAYAADPACDGLTKARASMHQAHGALAIVGLDGITEFADAIKQLLAALSDAAVPDTGVAIAAAQGGFAALRGYLDDLMAGHPDQPLKLFSPYRAMAEARGQPDPGAAALFFPDLTQRPPKREKDPPPLAADALAARLKVARLGFERGLLKWLKNDPKGIAEMKISVVMIEATRGSPASRAYWWIAIGVLDALAADGLPDANGAKRFAMRLGAHIKKLTEGQPDPDPQAMREALYQAACATAGGEQLAIVRAAYRLDGMVPTATPSETERLLPHIRRLRELLAAAKDDWNRLCAGTAAALPPFHEHTAKIAEEGAATGQADYRRLTAAILDTADQLRRDPARHDEFMALEIATAILLAESALENFQSLDAEFAHSTDAVVNRLAALGRGEELGMLDLPHLDAMARRAQERLLLESVAREIRSNLGAIETTLDAYFRDPARQSTLGALQQPIRQIQGALLVLGQDRANAVLAECAAAIERFAQPGFAAQPGEFEDVAKKLSALGFFVTQLQGGAADIDAILAPPVVAKPAAAEPEVAEPAIAMETETGTGGSDYRGSAARTVAGQRTGHGTGAAVDDGHRKPCGGRPAGIRSGRHRRAARSSPTAISARRRDASSLGGSIATHGCQRGRPRRGTARNFPRGSQRSSGHHRPAAPAAARQPRQPRGTGHDPAQLPYAEGQRPHGRTGRPGRSRLGRGTDTQRLVARDPPGDAGPAGNARPCRRHIQELGRAT